MTEEPKDRYWLIEGEHAKKALEAYVRARHTGYRMALHWCREAGGNGRFVLSGESVTGIGFDAPNLKLWTESFTQGFYWPKQNSKAGKQLMQEMRKLHVPGRQTVGMLFLGADQLYTMGRVYYPGLEEIKGRDALHWVILAKDVHAGHRTWKPIEGLREIRASEYHALKEAQEDLAKAPAQSTKKPAKKPRRKAATHRKAAR